MLNQIKLLLKYIDLTVEAYEGRVRTIAEFGTFLPAQKIKFSIKDVFSKCDQIRRKLQT